MLHGLNGHRNVAASRKQMQRNAFVVVINLNPRRGVEPKATTPADNISSDELLDYVLGGRRTKE
jgi:hypothetical protein